MADYRHEWKHEISLSDRMALRRRLGAVARPDPHAAGGRYLVRSLYFDTPEDRALREKLNGVNRREKFRLRYYNQDLSALRLEKKSKRDGLGTKDAVPLTFDEARAILDGDWDWVDGSGRTLIQELRRKMTEQGLRPRTIVDYVREPFVYAPGNVRVTLDYDLRTGLRSTDFLNPDRVTVPAEPGLTILEVKWDAFLPSVIRDAVQVPGCRTASFSKYALCRRFD